jgi:large subunit ribosomal protein L10
MPSSKILEEKKVLVSGLADKLLSACAGVLVSYKGINVEKDTALRKELREAGIDYTVVKNTLLRRAVAMASLNELSSVLEGTTALAVSREDCVLAAKILCKFAENNDFYKIKMGFVEGKVVSTNEVQNLAKLPSKEILVAQVLCGLNSPIIGLVSVLSGTMRGLVVALSAVAKKKSA